MEDYLREEEFGEGYHEGKKKKKKLGFHVDNHMMRMMTG